jgi:hypothetical protein
MTDFNAAKLDYMGRPPITLSEIAGITESPPAPPPPDRQGWQAAPTVYKGLEFRSRLEGRQILLLRLARSELLVDLRHIEPEQIEGFVDDVH